MNPQRTAASILLLALALSSSYGHTKEPYPPDLEIDSPPRALPITVSTFAVGINSGLVVAYGHRLPRPYRLETSRGRVFVNGVQVEPSLAKWEGRMVRMRSELYKLYNERVGKVPNAELRAQLLRAVLANPSIKSAHWMNDHALVLFPKRWPTVPNAIEFPEHHCPRMSPIKDKKPEGLQPKQSWLERLQADLRAGGCQFWGTRGYWEGPPSKCAEAVHVVRKIMSAKLSDSEREKRLSTYFEGSREIAKDIIANYNRNEWE